MSLFNNIKKLKNLFCIQTTRTETIFNVIICDVVNK